MRSRADETEIIPPCGTGKPLDLHVHTPDEFRAARRRVTFLSDAERRSELVRVA